MVISEQYTLKTSNSREGILNIVSELSPAGIIGAGKRAHINNLPRGHPRRPARRLRRSSARLQARGPPRTRKKNFGPSSEFGSDLKCALPWGWGEGVRYEAEHRFLDISKIHIGPVELKRLRFTPADLTSDQSSVVLGHLNLSDSGDKHDGTFSTT